MRALTEKLKKSLEKDERMKRCIICGKLNPNWHHIWIYAGKQINENWAIVALCEYHHTGSGWNNEVKQFCEQYSLSIMTEADITKYPKKNWLQIKKFYDRQKEDNL